MSLAIPETDFKQDARHHLVEFIFSSRNRMDFDAVNKIAKIDPDLSATHKVAQDLLNKTYMERPQELQKEMVQCMIRAGQTLMMLGWTTDADEPIAKRTTQNHVDALRNIVNITNYVQDETILQGIQNSLLTLFTYATTPRRKDLVKHPDFPWKAAVDQALTTPFDRMYRRFGKRLVILQQAPSDVLRERSREFAKNHAGGVPILLFDEFLQMRDFYYLQDKGMYDLMTAMPTGDTQTAWGVLEWALKMTTAGTMMEREGYPKKDRIPEAFIHQLWDAVETQWHALSQEDKNAFLYPAVLQYVDELWHITDTTLRTSPLARSHEFIHTKLASLSHEGHDMLLRYYDRAFKENPEYPVPSVLYEVIPGVAARIEARRLKK